ncbi:MAG: pentapeptide repeat-containing protein [Acidobacteriota bacterium]
MVDKRKDERGDKLKHAKGASQLVKKVNVPKAVVRQTPDLPSTFDEAMEAGSLFEERTLQLEEQLVKGVRVEGLDFSTCRLEACAFDTVAMPRSILRSAKWKDVRFTNCDLANCKILGLEAVRVEMVGCRTTGMEAVQSEWQSLLIQGGDQRYAQFRFAKFHATEFEDCDFEDADFHGADLTGCVFRRCNLKNAELHKAKLAGTDLRGSQVEGLRIGAEDLAGAIVDVGQALAFAPLLGIRIL